MLMPISSYEFKIVYVPSPMDKYSYHALIKTHKHALKLAYRHTYTNSAEGIVDTVLYTWVV